VYGTWKGKMLVLGGNQHNSIHIEHPDPTSKGVEYFVPIAYLKFAVKELEKGIPEIDIQILAPQWPLGNSVVRVTTIANCLE